MCNVNGRVGSEAASVHKTSGGRVKWLCLWVQPFAHEVPSLPSNVLKCGSKTANHLPLSCAGSLTGELQFYAFEGLFVWLVVFVVYILISLQRGCSDSHAGTCSDTNICTLENWTMHPFFLYRKPKVLFCGLCRWTEERSESNGSNDWRGEEREGKRKWRQL